MESGVTKTPWRVNLAVVLGTILTVVAALFLSQLDSLGTRLPPTPPIAEVTQVAEAVFTSTPLPVISMATSSPTVPSPTTSVTPISTPISSPSSTPSSTPQPTIAPTNTAVIDTPQSECEVVVPSNWVVYWIQPGDNLSTLSQKSGASMGHVRRVNCLETDDLVSGTLIFLPPAPPTPIDCEPAPPPLWEIYTVVRNDTISKLARSVGVNPKDVQEINCIFGDDLAVGAQIFLPPLLASGTPSPSTAVPGEATATATAVQAIGVITSPSSGMTVSGTLPILGTASFDPTIIQFYKVELMPVDGSFGWTTLGDTHNTTMTNGILEILYAEAFGPGDYLLRLVLIQDSNFAIEPHTVQITIE